MLIRLLIYIVLGIVLYRAAKLLFGQSRNTGRPGRGDAEEPVDDVMIQDPQCGVYFPQNKAVVLKAGGRTLYFCSEECRERYLAERS
jgi:uncharacterized protein